MSDIPMRLQIKGAVRAGGSVQAALLIGHPMESGYRTLESGDRVPKHVIESIEVRLAGALLWTAQTGIGMPANPYFAFTVPLPSQIPASGVMLSVQWRDDQGQQGRLDRVLVAAL